MSIAEYRFLIVEGVTGGVWALELVGVSEFSWPARKSGAGVTAVQDAVAWAVDVGRRPDWTGDRRSREEARRAELRGGRAIPEKGLIGGRMSAMAATPLARWSVGMCGLVLGRHGDCFDFFLSCLISPRRNAEVGKMISCRD